MMEIDGDMQPMAGLQDFHEATWVHKRNGIYYLSYSDNHDSAGQHNRTGKIAFVQAQELGFGTST